MKSRSHRPPMMEPRHDDWVDGSWTVDCICGVNFDDGEEMVDCDECGVWVHTRCSRYVKSDKSFSCDKCKSKNTFGGLRNDSEETEVAKFLLELPTKTMLDTPKDVGLWTDIPMEKRVHVQGEPGGEPDFFSRSEMSSIFGPQLWKSAGYVPKHFNTRYTEFPCLVEEKNQDDMNKEEGDGNGDKVNNDAGAFFSLLKVVKHPPRSSILNPVSVHCPSEAPMSKEQVFNKKSDVEYSEETTSVPVLLDTPKRRMEQTVIENNQNVKRLRTTEKYGAIENRVAIDSKPGLVSYASPPTPPALNDTKHFNFSLESGSKGSSYSPRESTTNLDFIGRNLNHGNTSTVENKEKELLLRPDTISKSSSNVKSSTKSAECRSTPVTEEVPSDSSQISDVVTGGTGRLGTELLSKIPLAEKADGDQRPESDMDIARPTETLKCELVDDVDERSNIGSLPRSEMNLNSAKSTLANPDYNSDILSEGVKLSKALMSSELHCDSKIDHSDKSPGDSYGPKLESTVSEVRLGPSKKSFKFRNASEVPDEILKLNRDSQKNSISQQHKVDASMVKSISNSGSSSDDHMAMDAKSLSSNSIHKESSECSFGTRKTNALVDTKCGRPKKIAKESTGTCFSSKMQDSTKVSKISNNSKGAYSDSKDFSFSSTRNVACARVSDDGGNPSIGLQEKVSASVLPSKVEKVRQGNMNSAPASSNVPAALSDEELALLLHQELNSSPRVPRVSRMRHTGSHTTGSILIKRSSNGGKDQIVSYRKKSKDLSRDGLHGYHRANLDAKKLERKPYSPEGDNTSL